MSIWDELGQKLTQGSQEMLQKARDLTGVVTMNSDISDSKRKIRDLYAELGELLVAEAFEGVTAEQLKAALEDEKADEKTHEIKLVDWKKIYSKVMFIRSEEEVIALNEAKISELKAAKMCPRCGARITKGMSFCPECGTRVAPEEAGQAQETEGQPEAGDGAAEPKEN